MNCKHCNKHINEGKFNGKLKSCQNCSTRNGLEHVFYQYPEAFGTTPKISSIRIPDCPQSYCLSCRGVKDTPYCTPILCSKK